MYYYHATPGRNLMGIFRSGLIPGGGPENFGISNPDILYLGIDYDSSCYFGRIFRDRGWNVRGGVRYPYIGMLRVPRDRVEVVCQLGMEIQLVKSIPVESIEIELDQWLPIRECLPQIEEIQRGHWDETGFGIERSSISFSIGGMSGSRATLR